MSKPTTPWAMPGYLEPFREYINNTGGNTVEELMDIYLNQPNIMKTNFVLGSLAIMCASQISLLKHLHIKGHLNHPPQVGFGTSLEMKEAEEGFRYCPECGRDQVHTIEPSKDLGAPLLMVWECSFCLRQNWKV